MYLLTTPLDRRKRGVSLGEGGGRGEDARVAGEGAGAQASEGMKGCPVMAFVSPVQTSRERFLRVPVSLLTVRKRRAPYLCAEASGDLLAHLDHPEVLFGLVVGEGDGGVEGKDEDLAGVFFEATEEILCGSGFDSSSAFSGKRPAGLDPCPGEESLEASEDLLSFRLAGHGGPGDGLLLEIEKEGGDLGSPAMAVELGGGLQLPKNMGVAEGMLWGEG